MGTTADKINYLNGTKAAIKEAIENKGVTVSDSDTFRSYAEKIEDISGGDPIFTSVDNPSSVTITSYNDWQKKLIKELDFTHVNFGMSNMSSMFSSYRVLTSFKWPENIDTSNVTDMSNMFYDCRKLVSLDLSKITTTSLTRINDMLYCTSLKNVVWGNNWLPNSSITLFSITYCPLSHESCLDLFNKLATRDNNPTLQLSPTTEGNMSEEEIAIATGKGWTVA